MSNLLAARPIHLCDWASQPDIHILCSGKWTTPKWGAKAPVESFDGVYEDEQQDLYTFDDEKVTCPTCALGRPKEPPSPDEELSSWLCACDHAIEAHAEEGGTCGFSTCGCPKFCGRSLF
jgi:hypothetical protein